MAFCFKRKESVSEAIRRLGCERIDHALKCLKDYDRAEAIHGARKDIKKVRAVLRLARSRVAKKDFRRQFRLLRDAATRLAAPRDAYIKVQALRNLMAHFRGQLASTALRGIRAELKETVEAEIKRFANEKGTGATRKALRRARKALADSDVRGDGWSVLGRGVKTVYRDGRRACRMAAESSSPENFHEWRKCTKNLWHQVRLLRPVWPEQMEAMASELKALDKLLGNDHDLVVLRQDLGDRGKRLINAHEWETLDGLIEQRRRELRTDALALGARFYAEKPSAFSDRLGRYWQTWRHGKNPPAVDHAEDIPRPTRTNENRRRA